MFKYAVKNMIKKIFNGHVIFITIWCMVFIFYGLYKANINLWLPFYIFVI